jgi:hypothetical protein
LVYFGQLNCFAVGVVGPTPRRDTMEVTTVPNQSTLTLTPKQIERFWSNVDTSGDCWEWRGTIMHEGYGVAHFNYRHYRAHRVSWELTNGPIPDELCVLHRCDNRSCVNPAHLFVGTRDDNMRDMVAKARQRHGDNHPFKINPQLAQRGEAHGISKLTAQQVREIRRLRAEGVPYAQIGRRFEISGGHTYAIVNRRLWAHVD